MRHLHVVHLLIRRQIDDSVCFLIHPHAKWPHWSLPTKSTVHDPLSPFLQGTSLEEFVDSIVEQDLRLKKADYVIEQEIEPAVAEMVSPTRGEMTKYEIYPVDVWVDPAHQDKLQENVKGEWIRCEQGIEDPRLSHTARAVFLLLKEREAKLDKRYASEGENAPEAPRRLLRGVARHPSMDGLAKKWLAENRNGVRHLPGKTLDEILAVGTRAFNLRVADPYLRYQMQGIGFTWSFFTEKDPQDVHVHGAPVVEIYGILEGSLEIWWKAYHDRGTSAWSAPHPAGRRLARGRFAPVPRGPLAHPRQGRRLQGRSRSAGRGGQARRQG